MSNVNKERLYVLSYKEIFLIFLTFSLILILLFPKDILKERLLREDSNYDLSVLYLQNMMRHDELNENFIMLLAMRSAKIGKNDLATKLTKLLLRSKDINIQKEATLLRYKLLKEDYFYLKAKKDKKEVEKCRKELITLFQKIMKNNYYAKKDISAWYEESLFLSQSSYSFSLLEKLLKTDGKNHKNIKLYADGFYLAQKLGKKEEALHFIHKLEQLDKKNRGKWFLSEYYFLMNNRDVDGAEKLLVKESKNSFKWKIRLAHFYMAEAKNKKAFDIYKKLFQSSMNKSDKKRYFIKAVKSLEAGNDMKEASNFASHYEDMFIGSKYMRTFILKLYLRSNELEKAAHYSKKILLKGES
jgi:hypothetical protein